jgi:hypothetical protein
MRLTQNFAITVGGKKNALEITWDVFNVANLLNQDWGHSYAPPLNSNYALVGTKYNATTSKQEFTFNPATPAAYTIADFYSRWRMQLGVRYSFN